MADWVGVLREPLLHYPPSPPSPSRTDGLAHRTLSRLLQRMFTTYKSTLWFHSSASLPAAKPCWIMMCLFVWSSAQIVWRSLCLRVDSAVPIHNIISSYKSRTDVAPLGFPFPFSKIDQHETFRSMGAMPFLNSGQPGAKSADNPTLQPWLAGSGRICLVGIAAKSMYLDNFRILPEPASVVPDVSEVYHFTPASYGRSVCLSVFLRLTVHALLLRRTYPHRLAKYGDFAPEIPDELH